ncbi:MotE family protein [Methylobacterium sp. Leaf111]|uniref:MotE family protein n=1 Tax=Methylobacterium sp. Leaf111 TaxID=1736257 RepID=UPI000B329E6C|nr:MotE family protein [Methylobacterium sp. Leaf111]
MSAANGHPLPGAAARLVVRPPGLTRPALWLALMALRVLLFVGLLFVGVLALAAFGLGPAGAVEGGRPAISGMNPGPLPKAAAKPAAPRLAVAAKPVADKPVAGVIPPVGPAEPVTVVSQPIETTGAIDAKGSDAKGSDAKASEAKASEVKPAEPAQVAEIRAPEPEPVKPAPKPPAYCASIADAAADARFAWQKEQLATLERQVEERIAALEAKRAEYETWLARRDAFLAKADEGVVAIYTKMRADAAALQLANMPDEGAAAILTKLNARNASAILSEMEAARAAQLARMMTEMGKTGAGKTEPGKKPRTSEKS